MRIYFWLMPIVSNVRLISCSIQPALVRNVKLRIVKLLKMMELVTPVKLTLSSLTLDRVLVRMDSLIASKRTSLKMESVYNVRTSYTLTRTTQRRTVWN